LTLPENQGRRNSRILHYFHKPVDRLPLQLLNKRGGPAFAHGLRLACYLRISSHRERVLNLIAEKRTKEG
jgi:hypothetical protein